LLRRGKLKKKNARRAQGKGGTLLSNLRGLLEHKGETCKAKRELRAALIWGALAEMEKKPYSGIQNRHLSSLILQSRED